MAPFGVLGVEDSMNWYKSNPYNVAIKNQNEVFYDRLMSRLRENVEDMVKRGETLMFEVIVVVAFK